MKLSEYLLDRIFSLICMLVAALVLLALLWLIETPTVFILFAEVILLAAYSTALLYDFFRKQSFYNLLQKMTEQLDIKTLLGELLVPPHFLEGQILVDVLRCCNKYQNDQLACAEQENREYREYLDSWVHEIKTPITSARLIVENEKNPTTLRIDDELRKIDAYVEQVLYYARSTDVEKDFKVEKTTLQALVYAALKTYSKPLIQVGGKPVLKELDIPVAADSKSCTFVIGQILSNAIKYRKDNLQVEFSARAEKNTVSLFISDNGIGISAADLPRVFDKGFTGENGRRYSKSTGIGLYLSQRLCRKMNISLSISSVPGQGTTVTMVFPTESYALLVQYKPDADSNEVLQKMIPIGLDSTHGYRYAEKNMMYETFYGLDALVSFLCCYIGLVFLLICAALLALKQLTETTDNVYRYGLLQKLGAGHRQINHTLFVQTVVFFAIPLVVAGVYSAFLIGKAMAVVEEFMNIHIATNIGLTIVLFLLVYGSYFFATYLSCKRIVTEQRELEV